MRNIRESVKEAATIVVALPLTYVSLFLATVNAALAWVFAATVERVVRH